MWNTMAGSPAMVKSPKPGMGKTQLTKFNANF
jgi:hypothetical protein